jgi:hypothetical protein
MTVESGFLQATRMGTFRQGGVPKAANGEKQILVALATMNARSSETTDACMAGRMLKET